MSLVYLQALYSLSVVYTTPVLIPLALDIIYGISIDIYHSLW